MKRQPHPRATIRDVARAAGVSPGTVSKILNDQGVFRLDTRRRVFSAARELGFRPSLSKLDAESQGLMTIGILTSDIYGRFTLPIMIGAEEGLSKGAVSAVMCDSTDDLARERFYLRFLFHRRVDAVIVAGKSTNPRPSLGRELPFPIMYAYQPSEDADDCSLIPDHHAVAGTAIDHLVSRGRRSIAHVTGPPDRAVVRERTEAAVESLAGHGLALVAPPLAGEWSERWGRTAVDTLIAGGTHFDAVFCASDEIARGVVTRLRERGLAVPADVAVIGVDNWTPIVEAAEPPLTTVDLRLREMGSTAAKILVDAATGSAPLFRGVRRFGVELVRRASA
jgi:LacI family transcriptional regulator